MGQLQNKNPNSLTNINIVVYKTKHKLVEIINNNVFSYKPKAVYIQPGHLQNKTPNHLQNEAQIYL